METTNKQPDRSETTNKQPDRSETTNKQPDRSESGDKTPPVDAPFPILDDIQPMCPLLIQNGRCQFLMDDNHMKLFNHA